MKVEKIISREYKVMLHANAFDGSEHRFLEAAGSFWREFGEAIDKKAGDLDGGLKKVARRRTIKFYDTSDHLLNNNSYIFRERRNADTGETEVTLKFRHRDRYFSQDRSMKAGDSERGKSKFEEDIKPVFETLYSFSTTQKISETKNLNKLEDVALLYPDLPDRLEHYEGDEGIAMINGFTELVIGGASFQIGKNPRLDSECALILWYDKNGDQQKPLVAEFSFKYGDRDGEYSGDTALRAYQIFQILQQKLKRWIDPNAGTKTSFAFG